jgi:mRNA-degrading endonuclease toxin of MazEF toxin-antitoxin module
MHPDGARLRSELALGPQDGMPEPCVASFDNLHTLRRSRFHQRITQLGPARLAELCPVFERALGCR